MKRRSLIQLVLRIILHTAGILPFVIIMGAYFTHHLTANPVQTGTQRLGDAAIIFLIASLAMRPFYTLTGFNMAIKFARPLGLYAFGYSLVHLYFYLGLNFGFNLRYLTPEFLQKPYLWVGSLAFLILTAMAITSYDWAKLWLRKNWKRLHRLVYLAAGLVVMHLAWDIKGDVFRLTGDIWKPLAAAGIITFLLLLRLPVIANRMRNRLPIRNP